MTVKELIAELSKLDGELTVILQKDGEGNGYSPLEGIDSNTGYEMDEEGYSCTVKVLALTPELRSVGFTDEDTGGVPCVVLFPV